MTVSADGRVVHVVEEGVDGSAPAGDDKVWITGGMHSLEGEWGFGGEYWSE